MEQENSLPEGVQSSSGVRVPVSASKTEKTAAFLMYLAAYFYVLMLFPFPNWVSGVKLWLTLFLLTFVGITELLNLGKRRPAESWVWLTCTALIYSGLILEMNAVWDEGQKWLFLHIFAVWWCVSRAYGLLEGRSGHLLPVDAADAFLVFPFRHFLLRIRTVFSTLRRKKPENKPADVDRIFIALAAAIGAAFMFLIAASLLILADEGFSRLVEGMVTRINPGEFLFRFILSLPVGAYLFGLIAGAVREDKPALRARGERINAALTRLGRVPYGLWVGMGAAFAVLYAVFFFLQGNYLFGAFNRTLPEGFIVSEYARRGFFELCGVMAVNFALLWCIVRTADRPVRENGPVMAVTMVILMESVLFAVVAASKIGLYIDIFGFTPLRLQSMWLVAVLFFGCVAAGYHILTGKRSMRAWMIFGAVTLSALCLW